MPGCLTTTGSWLLVSSRWSQYPWKPPLRPLAPAALQMGGRRRRGVSDKGTVCSVGKNKAEGERSSRVEQTGIRTTCVFYFTRQGHRVWEIYLSISFRTPLASGKKKRKKRNILYAGLTYFQNNELVKGSTGLGVADKEGKMGVGQRWVEAKTAAESVQLTGRFNRRWTDRMVPRHQKHYGLRCDYYYEFKL